MSTKWNNAQKLQKTPAVCKIPPERLPLSLEAFENYPLQAYAEWQDPFSPLDGKITGYAQLKAIPSSNLHFGSIKGSTHSLELDLEWRPATADFKFTVSLLLGLVVLDDRTTIFAQPTADLPFVAGLFTWDHDGTSSLVRSKIYS